MNDDYVRYMGAGCLVCWECFEITWLNSFQTDHDWRYLSGNWARRTWTCIDCMTKEDR